MNLVSIVFGLLRAHDCQLRVVENELCARSGFPLWEVRTGIRWGTVQEYSTQYMAGTYGTVGMGWGRAPFPGRTLRYCVGTAYVLSHSRRH